jgi:hypothetical protein
MEHSTINHTRTCYESYTCPYDRWRIDGILSSCGGNTHEHTHTYIYTLLYYYTFILSYYHTIILSNYHKIILSYYHTIILLYYVYTVYIHSHTYTHYNTIILSYYHTVILSYYRTIYMLYILCVTEYYTFLLWSPSGGYDNSSDDSLLLSRMSWGRIAASVLQRKIVGWIYRIGYGT